MSFEKAEDIPLPPESSEPSGSRSLEDVMLMFKVLKESVEVMNQSVNAKLADMNDRITILDNNQKAFMPKNKKKDIGNILHKQKKEETDVKDIKTVVGEEKEEIHQVEDFVLKEQQELRDVEKTVLKEEEDLQKIQESITKDAEEVPKVEESTTKQKQELHQVGGEFLFYKGIKR